MSACIFNIPKSAFLNNGFGSFLNPLENLESPPFIRFSQMVRRPQKKRLGIETKPLHIDAIVSGTLYVAWQPGGHGLLALDPWLCVIPFREFCLYHLAYFIWLSAALLPPAPLLTDRSDLSVRKCISKMAAIQPYFFANTGGKDKSSIFF